MISKMEAMQKLKKMGMSVVDDYSIITVLIPRGSSFKTVLKELKEKLNQIDYHASFCVKYESIHDEITYNTEILKSDLDVGIDEDNKMEKSELLDEEESCEMILDFERMENLISLDEDGQFSLMDL